MKINNVVGKFGMCFILIALLFVAISCTTPSKENNSSSNNLPNVENTNSTTLANPASIFCLKNGGTLKMSETPAGTQGFCILKDKTICDEWAYFRGECPVKEVIPDENSTLSSNEKVFCDDANRPGGVCTREYMPVCGFTSTSFNQVYDNKCTACSDLNVSYYVQGECTKKCEGCPIYSSPPPGYCSDGIEIGSEDDCGCSHFSCVKKNMCTAEQKNAKICTMEYHAVCGWFNANVKCLKYPCAITESNPCGACANENVEFWTEGECPKDIND